MRKSTYVFAALAVVALGVATSIGALQLFHQHDEKRFHTAWKDTFQAPGQMIRSVDAVVVARHTGTSPGRVAFSDNPEDAVPFELNHFVIEQGMKGLAHGTTLTVERVGGDANGETVFLDADGGPYTPGQQYVLFVNKQPESSFYYVVNDEGRFNVEGGRLASASEGGVAGAMRGMGLRELAGLVTAELNRGKK